jgi:hypothetical protein
MEIILMNRRTDLIDIIQGLARDEGTRQPSAGEWLADLDRKAEEVRDAVPQPGLESHSVARHADEALRARRPIGVQGQGPHAALAPIRHWFSSRTSRLKGEIAMKTSDLSRACMRAYRDKERDAMEALLATDFHFTSPLDNAIDRAAYFDRCWPQSATMRDVKVVEAIDDGDRAFIVYEVTTDRKRFRNGEMHTAQAGKLVSVEVYFGWDLPHPAQPGRFVDTDA